MVAVAAFWPSLALAQHWTGFRVTVGKFSVLVGYDLPDATEAAVRDPRRALFSVAALVQANADAFAEIPHDLVINVGIQDEKEPRGFVSVEEDLYEREDHPGSHQSVGSWVQRTDLETQIVEIICGRYPQACTRPPVKTLELFRCTGGRKCPGQIELGAIPTGSTDKPFGLLRPTGAKVKRLKVRREDMTRFFRTLEFEPLP